MPLDKNIEGQLAKIFADACAERATTPVPQAKLDPLQAIAILKREFRTLCNTISSLDKASYRTIRTQIDAYSGENCAQAYEHILMLAYTLGTARISVAQVKTNTTPPPTEAEYINEYKRVARGQMTADQDTEAEVLNRTHVDVRI
jgi:hypothetical protein